MGRLSGSVASPNITVRVVDNHPALLDGISAKLGEQEDIDLVGAHLDVSEINLITDPAPEVVVLDLYLGRDDSTSIPFIPRLVEWGAVVLIHTSQEVAVPLRSAIRAGAAGLCLKNDGSQALCDAVRAVANGEFACSSELARVLLEEPGLIAALTPREVEVVHGLDDGLTHQQIARRLHLAPSTVKEHLKSVRRKYMEVGRHISNAHSIVREARRDGWLPR